MDAVSPSDIKAYLDVMRSAGVGSGRIIINGLVEINAIFLPESEPMPAAKTEPGGWKEGTEKLDAPQEVEP